MSKIEDEIEAMFPVQREVIARATLAGCRFMRHEDRALQVVGAGRREWVKCVMYTAFLPDGTEIMRRGGYEDVYSASLACLSVLDYVRPPEDDDAFKLRADNEQARSE